MIFNTKKLKITSLLLLAATLSFGQSNTSALLPLPNRIEQMTGKKNFVLTPQGQPLKPISPNKHFVYLNYSVFWANEPDRLPISVLLPHPAILLSR